MNKVRAFASGFVVIGLALLVLITGIYVEHTWKLYDRARYIKLKYLEQVTERREFVDLMRVRDGERQYLVAIGVDGQQYQLSYLAKEIIWYQDVASDRSEYFVRTMFYDEGGPYYIVEVHMRRFRDATEAA